VPVLWVFVQDRTGRHRDEFFYNRTFNDGKQAIELYGARWIIEITFQELRSHLGLETTRGCSRMTVLRMAPCLMILCTIVVLFYDRLQQQRKANQLRIMWEFKHYTAFYDMIAKVRCHSWLEWVIHRPREATVFES
jgi:hypothetical protein